MKECVCLLWFYAVVPTLCWYGSQSFFSPDSFLSKVFGIIAISSVWWAGSSALENSERKKREKEEEELREQERLEKYRQRLEQEKAKSEEE